MLNINKPIGTSIFTYTVTKYKTADKPTKSIISNKSKTFNFTRNSLV
ncbi:MAG: hypothetical protein K2M75_01010 [Clostridia bacterium]|nr:hypothetical protein [Clostridia bacterium]